MICLPKHGKSISVHDNSLPSHGTDIIGHGKSPKDVVNLPNGMVKSLWT
jgi:hypothetical protein